MHVVCCCCSTSERLNTVSPDVPFVTGASRSVTVKPIIGPPAITRWAHRPRVWWLTVIGNSGAMTLYLWHIPVLLGIHLAFDYLGHPRFDPAAPNFVALSVFQLLVMAMLVSAVFVSLRPLENGPLPLWDGGFVAQPGPRSAVVGVLLCVAGAATLASVGWGLKSQGLYLVTAMLGALVAARALANDRKN